MNSWTWKKTPKNIYLKNNMEEDKYEIQIGGRKLTASFKKMAEQANGSVVLRYGDTVVLATATMSEKDKKDELGYFPLMVFYEEKFYAAGKIGGSRYTRREGKPSDRATLISRMIDRSIRPLFPDNLKREVEIIVTCLSWDEENDPAVLGGLASSIALSISDIPWNGPVSMIRVGKEKSGELILNPDYQEREEGPIEAVYSGFFNDNGEYVINMIESFFEEASDEEIIKSVQVAEKATKKLEEFQKKIIEKKGEEKISLPEEKSDPEIKKMVEDFRDDIEKAIFENDDDDHLNKIEEEIKEKVSEEDEKEALNYFNDLKKSIVREKILKENKRPDGRKADQIRELSTKVKILPRTHGSGLFSRGRTRSLSIITLGPPGDKKLFDNMEEEGKKRFMHHYNFPPYSVGESWPLRGPGRREIGHGMLGEKAIRPVLPKIDDFPYTIRSVSEILSSNGSTSQAAITSTSLALMDAGVPIKAPVTGISVGMVSTSKDDYRLLADIQGLEDHAGDMDFKVAGTKNGVTAIQMDVKIDGITIDIMKEALKKGEKYRSVILDKINEAIEKPREDLSPYAPRIITMKIDPDKIREVIGPGGKVINEIIDETEVSIDIEDSGDIFITSEDRQSAEKAVEWIKNIVREPEKGEIFKGKVKKIMNFGCFVEIMPGTEGLVHISELESGHVNKVEDVVKVGDVIPVKVLKVANDGKIDLSLKDAKKEIKKNRQRRDDKNK